MMTKANLVAWGCASWTVCSQYTAVLITLINHYSGYCVLTAIPQRVGIVKTANSAYCAILGLALIIRWSGKLDQKIVLAKLFRCLIKFVLSPLYYLHIQAHKYY